MSTCLEILLKVLPLSSDKKVKKEKKSEGKPSAKKELVKRTPTERDHYVYASIIAEVGY